MAGNPFAGQGITGLYDAPLKAAADVAGQKMAADAANRRTFAQSIGQGISTANSALQSKRNREMQNSMNREDNIAQLQRLEKNKELNLQYQHDLMTQKEDFTNTNVGALMDVYHEIDTTAIDPEVAVALKVGKLQVGLGMDPTNPQLRGAAKQILGVDDAGIDSFIAGGEIPKDSPYLNTTRDIVKSRVAGDRADSTKKVFDALKVETEVGLSVSKAEVIKAENNALLNFVNSDELTSDEKLNFNNHAMNRAKQLSEKASADKFLKDSETFITNRTRLVEYTDAMESLQGKFKLLKEAGAELNVAPLKNAAYETIGDADAASVQDFITKLKEEEFYVSGGNLSAQEMDDLRRSILVDVNKIIAGTAFIGRNFLGQTGTQTEPDFAHNLAAVFLPGQSVETRIQNLEEGRMKFDSNLIQNSFIYGDPDFASRRLRKFHGEGNIFDQYGAAKKDPGFERDSRSAAFSAEKGSVPTSMKQPIQVNYGSDTPNQQLPDMTQDSGYNLIDGSTAGEEDYSLLYNDI